MTAYFVDVYDCAGRLSQTTCTSFTNCVEVAAMLASLYPRKAVRAFNGAQMDERFDGLTEEERDAIFDAISDGHSRAERLAK